MASTRRGRIPGRPKQIIVVEGYLDVASLVQFGVENAVATLGTATTAENLRRLTRLTDRILFCFDGDRAGRAAAWRALETALPYGGGTLELKFLLLPEGDDPDSFVRSKGADAFRALAEEAAPLSDFLVNELTTRVDFKSTGAHGFDARETAAEAAARGHLSRGGHGRVARQDGTSHGRARAADVGRTGVVVAQRDRATGGGKRKTAVQKVINVALHYPGAAVAQRRAGRLARADRTRQRQAQDRRAESHQSRAALSRRRGADRRLAALGGAEPARRRSAAPSLRGRRRDRRRQHGAGA